MKPKIALGLPVILLAFANGNALGSEFSCYLTPDAAAAQQGPRSTGGFRLERMRRDLFSGATWASIRNCDHPEEPARLLLGPADAAIVSGQTTTQLAGSTTSPRTLLVLAGSSVKVFGGTDQFRIEVAAIALFSGAVGDRVRVRVCRGAGSVLASSNPNESETEHYLTAVVRERDLLEWVAE